MDQLASWIATAATIIAACMTASNLGSRITGYGFIVFTIASLAWLATGALTDQPALLWTNIVMTFLNLFGVWRWLGRQAKVEDGAAKAAEKSEQMATETLFPASTLTSAKLVGLEGRELGRCVDAMLGCRSGRLSYLVIARGGLAGVGETFRRLNWDKARVHEGAVQVDMIDKDLFRLPELAKDNWPGR
jgi:hypothetical protein